MSRAPISAHDAADRAQFLSLFGRILIFGLPLLMFGETAGVAYGWYGAGTLLLLWVLNLPLVYLLARLLYGVIEGGAHAFINAVHGAGNLPPDPAHSGCESLIARGFYREGAEAFEALLAEHPEDNMARVKLAEVYRAHLGEPARAEQLYQEIRRHGPSPREEMLAANLLIEHYRGTGQQGRLMVELARFADRYRGTRAGTDAARALMELKGRLSGDGGESQGGDGGGGVA